MTIRPTRGNLFIEKPKPEETTRSGIVLPAEDKRPQSGIVRYAGPEAVIQPGETVVFKEFAPQEVELDGVKYLVLEEAEVLAVITP